MPERDAPTYPRGWCRGWCRWKCRNRRQSRRKNRTSRRPRWAYVRSRHTDWSCHRSRTTGAGRERRNQACIPRWRKPASRCASGRWSCWSRRRIRLSERTRSHIHGAVVEVTGEAEGAERGHFTRDANPPCVAFAAVAFKRGQIAAAGEHGEHPGAHVIDISLGVAARLRRPRNHTCPKA